MNEQAAEGVNPRWTIVATRRLASLPLFRRDSPTPSARAAIGWWEVRRIPYNLIVGCAGIVTCIVIAIIGLGSYFFFNSDFGLPGSPLLAVFGVIIYGFLANLCYTGGWIAELIVRRAWPEEADKFASRTFLLGLLFSVLLTLTPAIVVGVAGIFELASHILGTVHQ
jgi:hypothetical protein